MALVDRVAILKEIESEVSSDDVAAVRRLVKNRIRQRYGSVWLLILSPIIGELVRLLIQRWKERQSNGQV
jgi:hypothetical protein